MTLLPEYIYLKGTEDWDGWYKLFPHLGNQYYLESEGPSMLRGIRFQHNPMLAQWELWNNFDMKRAPLYTKRGETPIGKWKNGGFSVSQDSEWSLLSAMMSVYPF